MKLPFVKASLSSFSIRKITWVEFEDFSCFTVAWALPEKLPLGAEIWMFP